MDFEGFAKIPRLSRDCIVSEKIDGTNGQVYIYEDEVGIVIKAGSRNRWVTPEADNHNFAKWVRDNSEQLIAELGLGRHYGEWWGRGINGRYKDAPKTFSLFNAGRWQKEVDEGRLTVCKVVPILYTGMFNTAVIQDVVDSLALSGSRVWAGAESEGIIIYHTASCTMFKKTLKGDESYKGKEVHV
mgnify:CR=1 FL=1